MKAIVKEDAKVLIPNKEHKNFTETDELIPQGTQIEGEQKLIEGLRRGEPFTYRVFVTNDNKVLYLNKIEPDMATEVSFGLDGERTPTTVNLIPAETFSKLKVFGLVAGGVIGYVYSKNKKMEGKKALLATSIGVALGYVSAYIVDRNRAIIVKPSK